MTENQKNEQKKSEPKFALKLIVSIDYYGIHTIPGCILRKISEIGPQVFP